MKAMAKPALLDKFVALMTLLFMAPLGVLVAIAIVADSGFPIFFSQPRLGLHGRLFRMFKFRKFPAAIGPRTRPLTLANDSRFTRVGKFLEKTKLDELPQLWNVITGDMAIVGPRPEVPDFADGFTGPARHVLDYRPGIFGPSQAAFRDEGALYPPNEDPQQYYRDVLFPAKAAIDLAYYPSRSLFSDVKWVLRGVLAVCGAEHERPGHFGRDVSGREPARVLAGK